MEMMYRNSFFWYEGYSRLIIPRSRRNPQAKPAIHPAKEVVESIRLAIFESIATQRKVAAEQPDTLRISLDSKAKVKVGNSSRGGSSRGLVAVKAHAHDHDHDMGCDAVLIPFGILEQSRGKQAIDRPFLIFGHSRETADFVADAIELWWNERKSEYPGVRCIQIERDNGPEIASSRTQFMRRLVEFCDRHQVRINLVYFPEGREFSPGRATT